MRMNGLNVGKAGIEMLVSGFCFMGIAVTSVWSFFQTWNFFYKQMGDDYWASVGMALMFQYGQNLFLFMAARTNKMGAGWVACYVGWAICAGIDASTNVMQWNADNAELAARGGLGTLIMQATMIALIFSEELAAGALGFFFHSMNNLRIAMGEESDERLEWAETVARSAYGAGPRNQQQQHRQQQPRGEQQVQPSMQRKPFINPEWRPEKPNRDAEAEGNVNAQDIIARLRDQHKQK